MKNLYMLIEVTEHKFGDDHSEIYAYYSFPENHRHLYEVMCDRLNFQQSPFRERYFIAEDLSQVTKPKHYSAA